jgi:hypothetical protein
MVARAKEKADGRFVFAPEIADALQFSTRKAYDIIRDLNQELQRQGTMTFKGRVPRNYFYERCGIAVSGKSNKSV